jgi:SH3-like domain-containing protein
MKQINAYTLGLMLLAFVVGSFLLVKNDVTAQDVQSQQFSDLKLAYRAELDKWMLEAYEGDRDAQFKVGVLFTNSEFNTADYEQAVYWYKQAARQGHVLAQYNLGHQYIEGKGVAKSETQAMNWWLEAAKRDHALAQFNVGRGYYLGIGLPKDTGAAVMWFQRAANNEEPKSIEILQKLREQQPELFSSEQLAQTKIEPIVEPDTVQVDNSSLISASAVASNGAEASNSAEASNGAEALESAKEADTTQRETQIAPAVLIANQTVSSPEAFNQASAQSISIGDGALAGSNNVIIDGQTASTPVALSASSNSPQRSSSLEQEDSPERDNSPELENSSETDDNMIASQPPKTDANPTFIDPPLTAEDLKPLPVFTNPAIRPILVTILESPESIELIESQNNWIKLQSESGLPAWIHQDFVSVVNGSSGIVTGSNVNIRAVPLLTNGSKMAQLNKGQKVEVLRKKDSWYNIIAPKGITIWAKTDAYQQAIAASKQSKSPSPQSEKNDESPANALVSSATRVDRSTPMKPSQENRNLGIESNDDWLFSQPSEHFTLQLASFDDQQKVNSFLAKAQFSNNADLRAFSSQSNGVKWVYFLHGAYPDKASAQNQKDELGEKNAWIRSIGTLRQNRCLSWKRQLPPPKQLNRYCTG